jgi:hypothetical protein
LDTSQNPPLARITGIYCDAIQAYEITTIEARFGCPYCVDLAECQASNQADAAVSPPAGAIP